MNQELINLFGRDNALLYHSIELMLEEEKNQSYFFMGKEEYDRISSQNLKMSNQIFWLELLNRVRYSSMVNLIRSKRWIDSMILSIKSDNLLAFCSSLRALIEAASDANFTFAPVPAFIVKELDYIKDVFDEKSPVFLKCKPLEDALIHYSHAGSRIPKSENSKIYNAKQVKQYIEYCDDPYGSLSHLYHQLSGYVHPSRESVLSYVTISQHDSGEYLSINQEDNREIYGIVNQYNRILIRLFHLSIFPSILNFKALSMVGIDSLQIKWVKAFNVESSWLWKDMLDKIRQAEELEQKQIKSK